MKKLLVSVMALLLLLTAGCAESYNAIDLSSTVRLEIVTVREDDGAKVKNIDYPVIGGLTNAETLNMINQSIYNYVHTQELEFDNALAATESDNGTATVVQPEKPAAEQPADGEGAATAEGEASPEDQLFSVEEAGDVYLDMRFKVVYNEKNILNILVSYDKSLGPDNEFAGMYSFVFDIINNEALTLGDVFDFESEFPLYINSEIEDQISKDANLVTYDGSQGFSGISKDAEYYVDGEYLYIFYGGLEIGPSKTVLPTFQFPLDKVRSYMNKDYAQRF